MVCFTRLRFIPDFSSPSVFFLYITKKHDGISIKMADKNLPWGLINDKISPGSAKVGFNAIV